MSWIEAREYRAIIGGCFFLNVPTIIEHNGQQFITVKKNSASGQIGIDANIIDASGKTIAEIRNDQVTIKDRENLQFVSVRGRSSIVESKTGKILYDIQLFSGDLQLDFKLSIATHLANGLPIFLHPNRIRIGSSNILKPHITSLKLATQKGMKGPALQIRVAPTASAKEYLHVPRAPMTGPGGIIGKLLPTKTGQVEPGMPVLMMVGKNGMAANISLEGPCYLLDVAFENFEIGIEIDSSLTNRPK